MTAQRIRGVRFEPDTRSGPSWLLNYHWQGRLYGGLTNAERCRLLRAVGN